MLLSPLHPGLGVGGILNNAVKATGCVGPFVKGCGATMGGAGAVVIILHMLNTLGTKSNLQHCP